MNIKQIEEKTIVWSEERQIIPNSTPDAQCEKLFEEFNETQKAHNRGNRQEVLDGIGDITVVLVNVNKLLEGENIFALPGRIVDWEMPSNFIMPEIASQISVIYSGAVRGNNYVQSSRVFSLLDSLAKEYGSSLEEAFLMAYDEIKDRKGKMDETGVFVKE